jgi:hypothetical protein
MISFFCILFVIVKAIPMPRNSRLIPIPQLDLNINLMPCHGFHEIPVANITKNFIVGAGRNTPELYE